jgi:hypothetical protein
MVIDILLPAGNIQDSGSYTHLVWVDGDAPRDLRKPSVLCVNLVDPMFLHGGNNESIPEMKTILFLYRQCILNRGSSIGDHLPSVEIEDSLNK